MKTKKKQTNEIISIYYDKHEMKSLQPFRVWNMRQIAIVKIADEKGVLCKDAADNYYSIKTDLIREAVGNVIITKRADKPTIKHLCKDEVVGAMERNGLY